jgi:hypothetical protein
MFTCAASSQRLILSEVIFYHDVYNGSGGQQISFNFFLPLLTFENERSAVGF